MAATLPRSTTRLQKHRVATAPSFSFAGVRQVENTAKYRNRPYHFRCRHDAGGGEKAIILPNSTAAFGASFSPVKTRVFDGGGMARTRREYGRRTRMCRCFNSAVDKTNRQELGRVTQSTMLISTEFVCNLELACFAR